MPIAGLLGYPLSHSFSKQYFTDKFRDNNLTEWTYNNYELPSIGEFPLLLDNEKDLKGLNVTIPYKEAVIPFVSELDPVSSAIGAVNTIAINRDGDKINTKGFNTDAYGFEQTIKPFLETHHHRALILGTGGAAKAVNYVLKNIGVDTLFATLTPSAPNHIGYSQLNKFVIDCHFLIINATPLGMFPNIEEMPPIPYEYLTDRHLCYDVIYNPKQTQFLKEAALRNAIAINGHQMLLFQAEKAWEIWNTK